MLCGWEILAARASPRQDWPNLYRGNVPASGTTSVPPPPPKPPKQAKHAATRRPKIRKGVKTAAAAKAVTVPRTLVIASSTAFSTTEYTSRSSELRCTRSNASSASSSVQSAISSRSTALTKARNPSRTSVCVTPDFSARLSGNTVSQGMVLSMYSGICFTIRSLANLAKGFSPRSSSWNSLISASMSNGSLLSSSRLPREVTALLRKTFKAVSEPSPGAALSLPRTLMSCWTPFE
mmetsp:Transcript_2217/g.5182  ORF Transcript_2217/g.5182 Transcript_2217/m.5182 type:complete len:236 (+) Transcript_2217:70-777(+)